MSTTSLDTEDVHQDLADVPLIVEDPLCHIEDLRETGCDATAIAGLWVQVDLLQGR